jgi:hypothetical protein
MQDPSITAHLSALEAFPEELKRQVHGLDEGALRYRPAADAWSAVEIVGHIMEVEALWAGRFRQILAAEHPVFPAYDRDEVVRQRDYKNKQPGGILIAFVEQRAELVAFLRVLRPAQLARTGEHPTRGSISVADGIGILADHDRAHSQQIADNIAAYREP